MCWNSEGAQRPTAYGMLGSFEPLIDRELRLEVPERMDAQGRVVLPLDVAALEGAISRLKELGAEALVIPFPPCLRQRRA